MPCTGDWGAGVLVGIVLAKLLTAVAIGFGLPAGPIGPTLVIGRRRAVPWDCWRSGGFPAL
jgi:H+/Cl- antiporter ClcA